MNQLLAELNVDIELLPAGSSVKEEVEWGVRWHAGVPGTSLMPIGSVERWYEDEGEARKRADRYPRSEADDEAPMWGQLICRNRLTIIGPTEEV
jgi:hypothetical protein